MTCGGSPIGAPSGQTSFSSTGGLLKNYRMRICQHVPLLVLLSYDSQMAVDTMTCVSQGNSVIDRALFSLDFGDIQIRFIQLPSELHYVYVPGPRRAS